MHLLSLYMCAGLTNSVSYSLANCIGFSMKNLEMEYRTGENERKREEISQSDEWYYII